MGVVQLHPQAFPERKLYEMFYPGSKPWARWITPLTMALPGGGGVLLSEARTAYTDWEIKQRRLALSGGLAVKSLPWKSSIRCTLS